MSDVNEQKQQAIATPIPGQRLADWGAAIWAGIIAGVVFLVLELLLVGLVMGDPWGPPHAIAAIVLGEDVLPPPGAPAPFDLGIVMMAMVVHFALSVIYSLILAPIIYRWSSVAAVIAGTLFGLLLYLVNFYGFTAIFPWFEMARNWISILSHAVFGLVAAVAYKQLQSRS